MENDIEDENTSTQRMIEDARTRRQNKNENFNCDNCDFKATSMTNLTNHKKDAHQRSIRKRYKCDECDYICTSEAYLKHHTEKRHKQNSHQCEKNSTQKTTMNQHNQIQNPAKCKRIQCGKCDKKFNKQETFKTHMKKTHGQNMDGVQTRQNKN